MPSTHLSLHVHVVFSTKHRVPFIGLDWRLPLHAYLGGAIRSVDAAPEAVGGTSDHVHLLLSMRATHCLADLMREVKSSTSRWVHTEVGQRRFGWQDGYGAFSVSASNVASVKRYIANQERHHRARSFETEYVALLHKSGIEFDERYLW